MAKVKLTRKFIKDALSAETKCLKAGSWLDVIRYRKTEPGEMIPEDTSLANSVCHVCAVGAVILHTLDPKKNEESDADKAINAAISDLVPYSPQYGEGPPDIHRSARELARQGRHMNALSYLFEGLMRTPVRGRRRPVASVVRSLHRFVDHNFPATIVVNIDGAKPARDVSVVRRKRKAA